MKLFKKMKDGGPKSNVEGYFLIEVKSLFSIAILKFNVGCRKEFHTHAFQAWTWFICGDMIEELVGYDSNPITKYKRSWLPKVTRRTNLHRVHVRKPSWCLTIRGPWDNQWIEYNEDTDETTLLTHGRNVVDAWRGNE